MCSTCTRYSSRRPRALAVGLELTGNPTLVAHRRGYAAPRNNQGRDYPRASVRYRRISGGTAGFERSASLAGIALVCVSTSAPWPLRTSLPPHMHHPL